MSGTRIAVIADIHGNDLALEAVLADIERRGISRIVNLGDHLSGALNAARTADILMARPDILAIAGNHDRWLLDKPRSDMGDWDRIAHELLSPQHLNWLAQLPASRTVQDDIFLCHGTPASDTTYWLDEAARDGAMRLSSLARIESLAEGFGHPVLLCGHTHIARAVRLPDGRLIVNPGSVGSPAYDDDTPFEHKVETGSPHARYAILENRDGLWEAAFQLVAYDHMAMARLAESRDQHAWASALSTGWLR
ncbi:metallophosphatase family protein [Shinella sp. CPCC 101442]|uniref:metallophosphoesterase family protein n=1 Tax=Shinella sp. CPCC 101442 TaxID=2932265 RepID=UPI0021528D3C|nr:metallophosphoesterase family protein [Shinella sp. CPCC 101442]MCR6498656.1 metallophosphatase family protein [Shinella sp. CPCC 101442]